MSCPSANLQHRYLLRRIYKPLWLLLVSLLLTAPDHCRAQGATECEVIARRIPPAGRPASEQELAQWQPRLGNLDKVCTEHAKHPLVSDISVIVKAIRFAILHQEFYSKKDAGKVDRLLTIAEQRAEKIANRLTPWEKESGRVIRGFKSKIDDSPQPIGLELPSGWNKDGKKLPLIVWLHGRGDKVTDLHFLNQRLDSGSSASTDDAIILHPFGRQCVGYKSAGETDVMEAIDFVCQKYPVDTDRIVLMGFSMGGAGVWHLAAHYTDRFIAASPGAGFAETAQYNRLTPEKYPPEYEQLLWGIYDVPGYTLNLFNIPVIAYSGENDKQIQAARVMEAAFAKHGRTLPHLIGPGMGHKYHPDTLAELNGKIADYIAKGRTQSDELLLQTRHLRYGSRQWITIDGMQEQYTDAVVRAKRIGEASWNIETQNVSRLELDLRREEGGNGVARITLGSQTYDVSAQTPGLLKFQNLAGGRGRWEQVDAFEELRKRPGLSGPIDDAFFERFLVVLPSQMGDSAVDRWAKCESENLARRWKELFRGTVRVKMDSEVTRQDMQDSHLVLWGTPRSNSLLGKVFVAGASSGWPMQWGEQEIAVGPTKADAGSHALIGIYPNPLASGKYVVINSGPTFRQDHDRTNSLQNPKLGDWAIIGLDQAPSGSAPGRVTATGFFDESWGYDADMNW